MGRWILARVKRDWVPEWLWKVCTVLLPVTFWPWRQILTRDVTENE